MCAFRRALLCIGLTLGLLGCQGVELYAQLTEAEANEILAVLQVHGITATKVRNKDVVAITVRREATARAIAILDRYGLPQQTFVDLGTIFQKQGLISSPLEERVRFIYGLSQMIGETLTQIDGVLTARVLVALPEEVQFDQTPTPPSASVFIKYLPGHGVEEAIPRIKQIVQNSIERLDYDRIAVALFPAQGVSLPLSGVDISTTAMNTAEPGSTTRLSWLLGALFLLALAGNGYLFWRLRKA